MLRLAAAIIDFTLVVIVLMPVLFLWTTTQPDGDLMPTAAANWTALAIIVAYPLVGVGHFGCTAGKWLCTLRVVRSDGSPAGWFRSAARLAVVAAPFAAGTLLPSVPEGTWHTVASVAQVVAIAAIHAPIVVDESRRGLHDRIAGTRVVTRVPAILRDRGGASIAGLDIAEVLRGRQS